MLLPSPALNDVVVTNLQKIREKKVGDVDNESLQRLVDLGFVRRDEPELTYAGRYQLTLARKFRETRPLITGGG